MSTASSRLYETDFYGWIQQQVGVLRDGNLGALDVDNLLEEIEDMGKSHQRALESRLEILLTHLLKWQFQPNFRGASWRLTIKEQRHRIADHLQKSPSLKPRIAEALSSAYRYAVMRAARETGIDESAFPVPCPWHFDQAMDADFWPESPVNAA